MQGLSLLAVLFVVATACASEKTFDGFENAERFRDSLVAPRDEI
ncbi:MAG: hypothetical protein QOK23_2565 [Gammaproteobacteria bacterium]|jgi:hypothetical protein|nr:hypothetical protein [Gammaproteobacteria bacterium]